MTEQLQGFLAYDRSNLVVTKKTHLFSLDLDHGIREKMPRAKTQSTPSSEKRGKYFSLRPWRLGAKNSV